MCRKRNECSPLPAWDAQKHQSHVLWSFSDSSSVLRKAIPARTVSYPSMKALVTPHCPGRSWTRAAARRRPAPPATWPAAAPSFVYLLSQNILVFQLPLLCSVQDSWLCSKLDSTSRNGGKNEWLCVNGERDGMDHEWRLKTPFKLLLHTPVNFLKECYNNHGPFFIFTSSPF